MSRQYHENQREFFARIGLEEKIRRAEDFMSREETMIRSLRERLVKGENSLDRLSEKLEARLHHLEKMISQRLNDLENETALLAQDVQSICDGLNKSSIKNKSTAGVSDDWSIKN